MTGWVEGTVLAPGAAWPRSSLGQAVEEPALSPQRGMTRGGADRQGPQCSRDPFLTALGSLGKTPGVLDFILVVGSNKYLLSTRRVLESRQPPDRGQG